MIARNTSRDPAEFPVRELLLIDAAGSVADVDNLATDAIVGGLWTSPVGIGDTEDGAVVFDVAIDAGASFILESTEAPTFRVALTIESRG